ncbi:MAG: hypothetical protein R2827_16575 [Bdellovibrionales bacterium]
MEDPGDETTGTSASDTEMDFTQTLTLANNNSTFDQTEEIPTKEIVYHDVTEEIGPIQPIDRTEEIPVFGMEGSAHERRVAKEGARGLWNVSYIIILFILGYVGYSILIKGPSKQHQQTRQAMINADRLLNQGRYERALEEFEKLYEGDPTSQEYHLRYAVLKLQLEGDTFLPRKLLEQLLESPDTNTRVRANIGMGLAHLMDNELGLAEFRFKEARAMDERFFPPVINIGIKDMMTGNWKGTLASMVEASTIAPNHIMIGLSLVRANIEYGKAIHNPGYFKKANDIIDIITKVHGIYHQEALLFRIYIETLSDDKIAARKTMLKFLDSNPLITEEYRYNLFIYRPFLNWKTLSSYCSEIIASLEDDQYTKAFEAFCLSKAEEYSIALKVIEDARDRAPTDPLVQSIYAYILQKMNLKTESSVALTTARKNNVEEKLVAPNVLQARFCETEQNWTCAIEEWERVLKKRPTDVAALTGAGMANLQMKKMDQAVSYVNRALSVTDDYVPLQILKSEIGK